MSNGEQSYKVEPLLILQHGFFGMMGTILFITILIFIYLLIEPESVEKITINRLITGVIVLGSLLGFPAGVGMYRLNRWPRKFSKESLQCAAYCAAIGVINGVLAYYFFHREGKPLVLILENSALGGVSAIFLFFLVPPMFDRIGRDDALSFINSIADQNKLWEFASYDPSDTVRLLATKKITDQNKLLELALTHNTSKDIRLLAVQKITDQMLIAKIAKIAPAQHGFPKILTKAVDNENEEVRCAAIWKTDDCLLLLEIIKTSGKGTIRNAAENRLNGLSNRENGENGTVVLNCLKEVEQLAEYEKAKAAGTLSCSQCFTENNLDTVFCEKCGERLES